MDLLMFFCFSSARRISLFVTNDCGTAGIGIGIGIGIN